MGQSSKPVNLVSRPVRRSARSHVSWSRSFSTSRPCRPVEEGLWGRGGSRCPGLSLPRGRRPLGEGKAAEAGPWRAGRRGGPGWSGRGLAVPASSWTWVGVRGPGVSRRLPQGGGRPAPRGDPAFFRPSPAWVTGERHPRLDIAGKENRPRDAVALRPATAGMGRACGLELVAEVRSGGRGLQNGTALRAPRGFWGLGGEGLCRPGEGGAKPRPYGEGVPPLLPRPSPPLPSRLGIQLCPTGWVVLLEPEESRAGGRGGGGVGVGGAPRDTASGAGRCQEALVCRPPRAGLCARW